MIVTKKFNRFITIETFDSGKNVLRWKNHAEEKILVIDDDEMNLQIAKMILEKKLSCEVICTDNGKDGVEILRREQVNLVLPKTRREIPLAMKRRKKNLQIYLKKNF